MGYGVWVCGLWVWGVQFGVICGAWSGVCGVRGLGLRVSAAPASRSFGVCRRSFGSGASPASVPRMAASALSAATLVHVNPDCCHAWPRQSTLRPSEEGTTQIGFKTIILKMAEANAKTLALTSFLDSILKAMRVLRKCHEGPFDFSSQSAVCSMEIVGSFRIPSLST